MFFFYYSAEVVATAGIGSGISPWLQEQSVAPEIIPTLEDEKRRATNINCHLAKLGVARNLPGKGFAMEFGNPGKRA